MPLYLTGSHSSRVRKPGTPNPVRRSSSSPLTHHARIKSAQQTKALAQALDDDSGHDGERLDATGKIIAPTAITPVSTALGAVDHSNKSMFCELPERAGMNSTRIAEVLNFRKRLPPILSLAHLHGLITASTQTEREIAALMGTGKVRKIKLSGRGNDISGLSEVLISSAGLESILGSSSLDPAAIDNFLEILAKNPRASSFPARLIPPSHVTALIKAGILVSSSLFGRSRPALGGSSLVAAPAISRAASGTWAAVGGDAAFENLGGIGRPKRPKSEPEIGDGGSELILSVPNIGPYLRLLNAARSHLIELLGRSQFKEAPLDLLRERWDGAVESDNRVSNAKRARGEFAGILPGQTKKWKDLYGLSFDWALEECLGAGLVELFETRSVGYGVRAF